MKRLTIVFLLAFVFANTYAQKGFNIGLSGSFNTVWIVNQNAYGGTEYKYKLKLGGGAGLDVGYNFIDQLGIQSGISYASEGQSYVDSHPTGYTRDYSLDYICIPILIKYTAGSSNIKFYADGGPRFSFLNSAALNFDYGTGNNTTIDGTDRYIKDDLGIMFGLGTNIGINKNIYVNIGMNFFYSFSDINSNGPTDNPLAYYPPGSSTGTWHWPWAYLLQQGVYSYSPSRNATGGLNVGIHYFIPSKKHH